MTAGAADEPVDRWEGRAADDLAGLWGVPRVHPYRQLGSTNDVAGRLAREGAPAGTTVVADEQLAGRGRAGRAWSSPPGLGLWLSLVARPPALPEPGVLPLLIGLEVARILEACAAPGAVTLKWPNDLLMGGRKVGGILCEAVWSGGAPGFVVVGLGVNVLHQEHEFPPDLRATATSLGMETSGAPSLLELATALVPRLYACTLRPAGLDEVARREMHRRDALRGRRVTVTDPATGALVGRGTAAGIAADGALLLRESTGEPRALHSGTVRASNDEDTHE